MKNKNRVSDLDKSWISTGFEKPDSIGGGSSDIPFTPIEVLTNVDTLQANETRNVSTVVIIKPTRKGTRNVSAVVAYKGITNATRKGTAIVTRKVRHITSHINGDNVRYFALTFASGFVSDFAAPLGRIFVSVLHATFKGLTNPLTWKIVGGTLAVVFGGYGLYLFGVVLIAILTNEYLWKVLGFAIVGCVTFFVFLIGSADVFRSHRGRGRNRPDPPPESSTWHRSDNFGRTGQSNVTIVNVGGEGNSVNTNISNNQNH